MARGRKPKSAIECPFCGSTIPDEDDEDDTCFQTSDPENSVSVYHKQVYCRGCDKIFFYCRQCLRVTRQRYYSQLKGACICNNLDTGTDSPSIGGNFNTAEDVDDNETSQFNSTSDNNLNNANVEFPSAPPDAGTSPFKSNSVDNLDNATVESVSSDTFVGKSETVEVQVETESRSPAESDSERIKRVLSNPDEYLENSYIYFYNESMGEGRGRRAICRNSLSESSVNEIRGKRGRDRSLSVVY